MIEKKSMTGMQILQDASPTRGRVMVDLDELEQRVAHIGRLDGVYQEGVDYLAPTVLALIAELRAYRERDAARESERQFVESLTKRGHSYAPNSGTIIPTPSMAQKREN